MIIRRPARKIEMEIQGSAKAADTNLSVTRFTRQGYSALPSLMAFNSCFTSSSRKDASLSSLIRELMVGPRLGHSPNGRSGCRPAWGHLRQNSPSVKTELHMH
jgi:hypothetical protein